MKLGQLETLNKELTAFKRRIEKQQADEQNRWL